MTTRPSQPDHVASTTGGEQLKMFMTPREIHASYQPLDADRESSYEGGTYEGTRQPKSWDTGSTAPTDAGTATQERADRRVRGVHSGPGGDDSGTIRRTWGGGKVRQYDRGSDSEESDDELWDRKLSESQEFSVHGQYEDRESDPSASGSSSGWSTYQGEASGSGSSAQERHWDRRDSWENAQAARHVERMDSGDSLYDSIAAGGVRSPIRLGMGIGSQGKREIVGGHHRLAAATDIDQDKLVPVIHDKSIQDARNSPSYPYS